jgi:hypothetical protein
MTSTNEALVLFLKSLPVNSFFEIISFGSKYQDMHRNATEYTQESVENAIKLVNKFDADFGGTEIYLPLEFAINKCKSPPGFMKIIFLLTDGET